jgi:chromosome segregation ATPase
VKGMSEEKTKQYIASLKSELTFYKEEYQKFKHQEFEYEDIKEELAELKQKHEEEKKKLEEKIDWLKACVNEQKPKTEQSIVQYNHEAQGTIQELQNRLREVTEQKGVERSRVRKPKNSTDLFLSLQRKMDK